MLPTGGNYKKQSTASEKERQRIEGDAIDSFFGFNKLKEGPVHLGWLLNYLPITLPDEKGIEKSGMNLYFIDRLGGNFKATIFYDPYFYVEINNESRALEISHYISRKYENYSLKVEIVEKQDLTLPNHLSGKLRVCLKLSFNTVNDLVEVRNSLRSVIAANVKKSDSGDIPEDASSGKTKAIAVVSSDPSLCLVDMKEYDIPYTVRVSIDLDIRVGAWYNVSALAGSEECQVVWQKEFLEKCSPRVVAFDIECEKSPLKFPNAERDRIFMISYMLSPGQGFLIINREIVSEDIDDFEYTPMPKYPGPFKIFNEASEKASLERFMSHLKEIKPHVMVTYNGDNFDWPYVATRCAIHGINLYKELGIRKAPGDSLNESEFTGRCMVHLDAFRWVQRDSYLPQGCHGLKAVTKAKLGYDPVEVDPEDMLRFAVEKPDYMASYSVSDAVATYYLYSLYVHNFIFSMCTILPLTSEDVLRKGSGTLCEALLMVEAYRCEILCPNKQVDSLESFYSGHLLEAETYIGGHVECIEAGVFRADIPVKFRMVPSAFQHLIDHVDRDLTFAIETEHGMQRSDIVNYDEVKQSIVNSLELLRDAPNRSELPRIYHLDVGAMYPNIILTNRLQPSAIVSASDCASCDFNRAENGCKRPMEWTWRGDYLPATHSEYQNVKRQLMYNERFTVDGAKGKETKAFAELPEKMQVQLIKTRLKAYCQKVYKKSKITEEKQRINTICMRENPFYVDTVRAFRDRRYDYKLLTKQWKGKKSDAEKKGDVAGRRYAEDMEILMDSLQLAHKCILNSFYGYVMRKGARWRSMEMAGIVTYTGAQLIRQARELVEQIGRPLELDTDGIWCVLPSSFPQDFKFITRDGGKVGIQYPCAMLNADVHERYTNVQYQDLVKSANGTKEYATHAECSIYFELDGPYRAMILPASPEEGRLLKKKYVVFNFDGSVAELKGFEIKRRGELEMVKIFQSQVFDQFLVGKTLQDCYDAVGLVANRWLDVLDTQGRDVPDDELLDLISERKTISKTLDDYEGRKATSLTTANRLSDFLGLEMVKDKGLNCNLIISMYPRDAPVTDRAIPVAIFSADHATREYFLRKWMKEPSLNCDDFRNLVDWSYYRERISRTIQKIVTVPSGMQAILNPCPRVAHPAWLLKSLNEKLGKTKQTHLTSLFKPNMTVNDNRRSGKENNVPKVVDIEDMLSAPAFKPTASVTRFNKRSRDDEVVEVQEQGDTPENEVEMKSVSNVLPIVLHIPQDKEELLMWLESRKEAWRAERLSKNETKKKASSRKYGRGIKEILKGDDSGGYFEDSSSKKKSMSVMDLVRNASLSVTRGYWQIIEFYQTDVPGEFTVFAMTQRNQLQKLTVNVPRYMYINCRDKFAYGLADSLGGKKVQKDLPHGHKIGLNGLMEVSISEKRFLRNEKSLSLFLSSASVEGVYETQTPLWLRLVMNVGCICRVKNNSLKLSSQATTKFNLDDLDFVVNRDFPYLAEKTAQFHKIYIYAVVDKSRSASQLGAIGLFFVDDEFADGADGHIVSGKAYVWLVNTSVSASGLSSQPRPPMNRLHKKYLDNMYNSGFKGDTVKYTTEYTNNVSDAWQKCSAKLDAYYREQHGPSVVFVQGSVGDSSAKNWRKNCPILYDMPVVVMPFNSTDEYFPLTWQLFVAERMIQRFLIFPTWLEDRLHSANYSYIPLSSLGRDATMGMIDVLYARHLQTNKHVLWCSEQGFGPNKVIDCGGANDIQEFLLQTVWSESLSEPVINNSGIYRNICVSLELSGLCVNAILFSHLLDSEGLLATAFEVGAGKSATNKFSELFGLQGSATESAAVVETTRVGSNVSSSALPTDASCGKAFVHLKALVSKWSYDAEHSNDLHAQSLLTNLYRYLCGGNGNNSLLSDPALHRIVYGLMVKLFKKLIVELRKLNVNIIFAAFDKLVISASNKFDMPAAEEYVSFIIMTVLQKEMFQKLEIRAKKYWNQLFWFDNSNWCGGYYKVPEAVPEYQEIYNQIVDEGIDENVIAEEDVNMVDDEDAAEVISTGKEIVNVEGGEPTKVSDKWKNSKLFSMWAKSGESATLVDAATASSNIADSTLASLKGKKRRGKKKPAVVHNIDEDGDEPSSSSKNYDFLDHLLDREEESEAEESDEDEERNVVSHANSDDEAVFDDNETDIKHYSTKRSASFDAEPNHQSETEQIATKDSDYIEESFIEDESPVEDSDAPVFELEHHWSIVSYLPRPAIVYFEYVVAQYMTLFQNKFQNVLEDQLKGESNGNSGAKSLNELLLSTENAPMDTPNENVEDAVDVVRDIILGLKEVSKVKINYDTVVSAVTEYMRKLVSDTFMNNMLTIMDQLRDVYGPAGGPEARSAFDLSHTSIQVIQSANTRNQLFADPVLEFAKVCLEIFCLDKSLPDEVAALRRGLLTQLKIREYSAESEFQNNNASYILSDMVCSYCNSCRDVDMMRDFEINGTLNEESEATKAKSNIALICSTCGHEFDRILVENKLLGEFNKLNITFLLQDLRCPKTKRVSTRLCTAYSDLSVQLTLDTPAEAVHDQLLVLYHVAKHHKFDYLCEVLERCMAH